MDKTLLEKELQQADRILPIPLAKSAVPKALIFDLSEEKESTIEVPQNYLNKYVGGPALAARLWANYADSSSNPIIITGSTSGSLITVAFKSPATGNLFFNTFSGRFNFDYCAVIILGSLSKFGTVDYSLGRLVFNFDNRLKRFSTDDMTNFYPGCITTGVAAENGIIYSSAVCNNEVTGRGGLGYVMNEKNLKAVCLGILPTARDTFDFSIFVKNASVLGWAPVDNISKRTDPRLFHLSASEKNRKLGDVVIPCQALLMLGSNTGCYDVVSVYARYKICLEAGLDPVSMGNILGWAREVQERGIVVFPIPIDFTQNDQVMSFMTAVVERRKGYEFLGDGLLNASRLVNNKRYSKEINNLECGPFDYRGTVANALNEALGNWFTVFFDLIPGLSIKNKVDLVIYNEELTMGLQCLNINPEVVVPVMINKLGFIKRALISKNIIGLEHVFNTADLNITDAFTVGQNCRYIVRKINSLLNNNKPSVPDFFCVDPESNAKDETIVDIRKLLSDYNKVMEKIYLADSHI